VTRRPAPAAAKRMTKEHAVTRRALLQTLGVLGVSAALPRAAPVHAGALGGPASVQDALARMFGNRPITDGSGVVTLGVPHIAEDGAVVPVSVDVASPMTPANHVRHVYVVADGNRIPIITRVTLGPECGQASVGISVRLGETGDVRAIVEQGDGTLLQVRRVVTVIVSGCGG
jgi:sulfur-oxidizing protein SoxY